MMLPTPARTSCSAALEVAESTQGRKLSKVVLTGATRNSFSAWHVSDAALQQSLIHVSVVNFVKLARFRRQICDIHLHRAVKTKTVTALRFRPRIEMTNFRQLNEIPWLTTRSRDCYSHCKTSSKAADSQAASYVTCRNFSFPKNGRMSGGGEETGTYLSRANIRPNSSQVQAVKIHANTISLTSEVTHGVPLVHHTLKKRWIFPHICLRVNGGPTQPQNKGRVYTTKALHTQEVHTQKYSLLSKQCGTEEKKKLFGGA